MEHQISIINRLLAAFVIASNVYFLPTTLEIICTNGGPMGFGYVALPFILPLHIVLIFSIVTFRKKSQNCNKYLLINSLSVLYILSLSFLLYFK